MGVEKPRDGFLREDGPSKKSKINILRMMRKKVPALSASTLRPANARVHQRVVGMSAVDIVTSCDRKRAKTQGRERQFWSALSGQVWTIATRSSFRRKIADDDGELTALRSIPYRPPCWKTAVEILGHRSPATALDLFLQGLSSIVTLFIGADGDCGGFDVQMSDTTSISISLLSLVRPDCWRRKRGRRAQSRISGHAVLSGVEVHG